LVWRLREILGHTLKNLRKLGFRGKSQQASKILHSSSRGLLGGKSFEHPQKTPLGAFSAFYKLGEALFSHTPAE
jgi:hypothetical protein